MPRPTTRLMTGESLQGAGHDCDQRAQAGDHCHHHHGHHHHARHVEPRPVDDTALISARGLRFARGGRDILQAVDLDLHTREIVTLIGPNGAGKTTLVRMLLGLAPPDGGSLQRQPGLVIGYVPQRFDIDPAIPLTVARFLTLGPAIRPQAVKQGADAGSPIARMMSRLRDMLTGRLTGWLTGAGRAQSPAIAKVLAEVGADGLAERQLARLSGGELQRVMLARALLRNPDLLVLDEPVRGVDYAGEAALYSLISRIRDERGIGILLVSHDLHIVMAQSTRVICINGHICCSGVPELVAQDPEYARLFGPQAARALGLYRHNHDHSHDLSGAAIAKEAPASGGNGADGGDGDSSSSSNGKGVRGKGK